MIGFLRACWRARWNALRLCIAAFLLCAVAADTGARLARRALAQLPDYDFAAEVAGLRAQGRFGESIAIADAGLDSVTDPAQRERIRLERDRTRSEQSSWLRRAKDLGWGALTGGAGGFDGKSAADLSMETLVGAVAADMLVIGDVRDLLIQGYRYAGGNETDPVIVALSVVGIATTVAPEVDWAPSILKSARRIGAMGEKLGGSIVRMVKAKDARRIEALLADSASLARKASPAGAARMFRLAQSEADIARMARFVEKSGPRAVGALHVTGEAGAAALRQADALRLAGKLDDAARLEALVLKAGAKGERGARFLKSSQAAALMKPHFLVGGLKSLYKGHAAAIVQRALESLDPFSAWVLPLLSAWTFIECGLMLRRCRSSGPAKKESAPARTARALV